MTLIQFQGTSSTFEHIQVKKTNEIILTDSTLRTLEFKGFYEQFKSLEVNS
jgi:hypothetical protein